MGEVTGDALPAALDVLVFRRVGRRWTHLGGEGRGAAWAGSFDLADLGDARLERALQTGRPVRRHGQRPHHVIGPYWACTSAVVRVDADHAVVLGSAHAMPDLLRLTDDHLVDACARAADEITTVSPAKHLADEVEVLTALRRLTLGAPPSVASLLDHLVATAAEALSCDLAAVWLDDGRHAVATPSWCPPGGAQRAVVTARQLAATLPTATGRPEWLVVQDATEQPLPMPIGADPDVASYLAVPMAVDGAHGCLLLVHATQAARGFTSLCQSLALQLSEAGARLVERAGQRDDLVRELKSSREHALLDPLTGAANRRGWDEAVARAREHVATGGTVTVVTVDLDELKQVNDTHGHEAGDRLIIACAEALRRCVRGDPDVIARIGGDEFALLIRGDEVDPVDIADRLRLSLESTTTASGLPLRTSVGAARCEPGGSIEDAARRADVAMDQDKRARRGNG
ncbi:MAG: diguanylate cyclase domain-containing protein [Angustibacter sp.]